METLQKARLRERLFRVSVVLKGLDALIELAAGIALWRTSPRYVVSVVRFLTRARVLDGPRNLNPTFLQHEASRFSIAGEHFMAIYLVAHGLVKVVVVVALLKDKLWAYPVALVVFAGFVVYQIDRFTQTGGFGLVALSAFDLVVIWLVWLEYRAVKAHAEA